LPFSQLNITLPKPVGKGYTKLPQTIGNHIRNRRLELGLEQLEVGNLIGVSHNVIGIWERGEQFPNSGHRPKIVQFLGFVPWFIDTEMLGGKLEHARLMKGLSLGDVAKSLGTAKATVMHWEQNLYRPKPEIRPKITELLQVEF
jgi:transcriptional regulator with XRE-family HTH domain